jgi:hypothetical protein
MQFPQLKSSLSSLLAEPRSVLNNWITCIFTTCLCNSELPSSWLNRVEITYAVYVLMTKYSWATPVTESVYTSISLGYLNVLKYPRDIIWRRKGIKNNSVAWVRERPPLVGEVSANFADRRCHVVSVTSLGRILCFLDRRKVIIVN